MPDQSSPGTDPRLISIDPTLVDLKTVSNGRFRRPPIAHSPPENTSSDLDKDSQGRIDDPGAPDPASANMSPRSHD
jgi:hypothetical protein